VETYPVDVDPKEIVRWLMDEERQGASDLLVTVTRTYWRRALGPQDDSRLGDAERDDLGESTEVGLVEVRPRHQPSLWTLRIRVPDDIGPALPEDEPVPDGEEEIDLATFDADFIKADRGLAEASAEVESAGAKGSLTRVLEAMREDRHNT